MADAFIYTGIGIVEMDTTNDTFSPDRVAEVESIIFSSINAGLYTITIDGWAFSVTTTAEKLVEQVIVNRPITGAIVSAIAVSGKVFLLLRSKSSG